MNAGESGEHLWGVFRISAKSRERTWKGLKPGHETKFGFLKGFFWLWSWDWTAWGQGSTEGATAERGQHGEEGG